MFKRQVEIKAFSPQNPHRTAIPGHERHFQGDSQGETRGGRRRRRWPVDFCVERRPAGRRPVDSAVAQRPAGRRPVEFGVDSRPAGCRPVDSAWKIDGPSGLLIVFSS